MNSLEDDMGMATKSRPADADAAIQKFLEDGGRVKLRAVNTKTIKHDTWQGAKVTIGFKLKELQDGK